MEDVATEQYPFEKRNLGEKRLMVELANSIEYADLVPGEKRRNNFPNGGNPNQPPLAKTIPVTTISGPADRGEKRTASEALANQTSK